MYYTGSNAFASLRQGLVGAWCPSLPNGGSGNTLPDVSGYGNHGSLVNMSPDDWVSSQYGRALDFDGVNDVVNVSDVILSSAFTGSLWFYKRTNGTYNGRIVFGNQNDVDSYLANVTPTSINTQSDTSGQVKTFAFTIANLIWYHVAVVRDDSNNVRVFLNGIQSVSGSQSVTGSYTLNRIGQYADSMFANNEYRWDGQLDDVRLYSRALTEPEIKLLASRPGIGLRQDRDRNTFYQFPSFQPALARRSSAIIGGGIT